MCDSPAEGVGGINLRGWFWGFTASASPRDSAGNFHWKFSAPSATSYRWGGGSKSLGHWVAVTARGSRADFFFCARRFDYFSRNQSFQTAGHSSSGQNRACARRWTSGYGRLGFSAGIFGELFSNDVSTACRLSQWGGGINPWRLSCRAPRGRRAQISARFGKLFLLRHLA